MRQCPQVWPRSLVLLLLCATCWGCSPSLYVRPVGQHQSALQVSAGGPWFTNLGMPAPMPLGSLVGKYGVGPRTDISAGLVLTPVHTMGLSIGAGHLLSDQHQYQPAMMVGAQLLNFFNPLGLTHLHHLRSGQLGRALAPTSLLELSFNASWLVGSSFLWWIGGSHGSEWNLRRGHVGVVLGAETFLSRDWSAILELRCQSPHKDNRHLPVRYIGVSRFGALATYVGIRMYFSGD